MIPEKVVVLLVAALANAAWAEADIVEVQNRGPVDLAPFTCTDITRSTMIDRVCYDASRQYAVIEVQSTYREFCGLPQAKLDALLNAPSMGQFYNKRIGHGDPHDAYPCAAGAAQRARSHPRSVPAVQAND